MKEIVKILLCMTILALPFVSCSSEDGESDGVWTKNYVFDWGTTKENLLNELSNYTTVEDDNEIVYVYLEGNEAIVSYQFENEALCAIAFMSSLEKISKSNMESIVNGYEFIGSLSDGKDIYVNENTNTILQVRSFSYDGNDYYALGWEQNN